jgi:predicted cupin superfamily sugar epimerase
MNRVNLQFDADYFKKQLNLQKHPEGGWFKETYR